MKRNSDATIQDMIIDELYDGLGVREESGGLPDGLYRLYNFLDTVLAGITPSFESVKYATSLKHSKKTPDLVIDVCNTRIMSMTIF